MEPADPPPGDAPPAAAPDGGAPLATYLLGSVVLWTAVWPLVDWLSGSWKGWFAALAGGAFMGVVYGLVMHPFEGWLRRRAARKAAADGNDVS